MKLLIDGDILLYTSSVASEFVCDWGGDNWVLSANLEQSRDIARSYLNELSERFTPDSLVICLSGPSNFRVGLNPNYKSNRKDTRKPIIYNQMKDWLMSEHDVVISDNMEADDMLGILATSGEDTIIVSADKDMQCVPGRLFRQGELLTITEEQANRYHMLQTLTGDATDGYPGCPGVGPKTAEKLLQGHPETHWGAVLQAYQKAGLTEDDALMNARMAYILRSHNYENGEIRLWTPNP